MKPILTVCAEAAAAKSASAAPATKLLIFIVILLLESGRHSNTMAAMKYRRQEAKEYAREHLRGLWAATLTPFARDLSLDEAGWRANVRHWYRSLGIRGLFVNGKQGEFASMTVAERKRAAEIAVEEALGNPLSNPSGERGVMVSCSDQSVDT